MTERSYVQARDDFETLLLEEGTRAFWLTYTAPIERVLAELHFFDKAQKLPVRPWVIGECCDHIYPTCPAVVRTGRLDAKDGNWRLGNYPFSVETRRGWLVASKEATKCKTTM